MPAKRKRGKVHYIIRARQRKAKKENVSDGIIRHRWVKDGITGENSSRDYCARCGVVKITTHFRTRTLHLTEYWEPSGDDYLVRLGTKRPQCVRPDPAV